MADDVYSCGSGESIYAGLTADTPLSLFIDAMPSNSWSAYTGTNINEMTPRTFDNALMGVMETEANKPLSNWCNKFTYDPANLKISGVGTAEGYITQESGKNYSKEVVFDMRTNAFSVLWNPTDKPEGHCYDSNMSLPMNGFLYRKAYSNSKFISKRSTANQVWSDTTFTTTGLSPSPTEFYALEGLPQAGAQGSLFLLEAAGRLIRFDIATGVRSLVGNFSGIGRYPVIFRVKDYLVFGAGEGATTIYKLDKNLNVTTVTNSIPVEIQVNSYGKLIPCPSGTDAAYSFTNSDAKVRKLNILTGAWSIVSDYPTELATSVYVAITALQGLGAFALWKGRGRSAGVTRSTFLVYRI